MTLKWVEEQHMHMQARAEIPSPELLLMLRHQSMNVYEWSEMVEQMDRVG